MSEGLNIENVPTTHEPVTHAGVDAGTGNVVNEEAMLNDIEGNAEADTTGNEGNFNPENIDFGIQSYDLSRFEFSGEVMESIQPSLNRFSEANLTQAQLDVVMDEIIGSNSTVEDYEQTLEKSLTHDEKRNYKNVVRFADELYKGTDVDPIELMKDPYAVKLLNVAFTKTKGKPTQTLSNTTASTSTGITQEEARMRAREIGKKANVSQTVKNSQYEELIKATGNANWAVTKYGKFIK